MIESSLRDKVAIVTGGSRGIGKAIASAFSDAGAAVMITSRKADGCEAAAAEIGGSTIWCAGNAGDPDDIERVVDDTIDRLGPVDILVNNAATNPYAGPMIDVEPPAWEKTIQVNLTGPLIWSQLVWRRSMVERGGVIVNISSVGALSTNPVLGVYDVTKAALLHLTQQLAAELAPGVRVNAIAPGLIKTDFARMLWEGGRGEIVAETYPLKRLGEVEDIAQAAVYLSSEASGWMTGQTLVLDGGGMIAFRGNF